MSEYVLSNGVKIPDLCYGTSITSVKHDGSSFSLLKLKIKKFLKRGNVSKKDIALSDVIKTSMKHNCNMFDTSRAYGASEYILGKSLKAYDRNAYFIVTKLCNPDQFKKTVREGLEKSLKELELEYVDLYLMHWPVDGYFLDSWKEMEKLYREGKCRAIGVCNCNIHHLEELSNIAEIMPMVNQIECHPLFTQEELRTYCNQRDIQIMAYTSTARMDARLKNTVLLPISKKYNKTISQVILKWHQQIGNIPIFNTTSVEHLIDNVSLDDFELSEDEIKNINSININSRLRYDPDNCDFTKL